MIQLTFYAYISPVCFNKHADISQSEPHACYIFFKANPSTIEFFKNMSLFRFGNAQSIVFN